MEKNYTPLDVEHFKVQSGGDYVNTLLFIMANVTVTILAFLLFILIRSKIHSTIP